MASVAGYLPAACNTDGVKARLIDAMSNETATVNPAGGEARDNGELQPPYLEAALAGLCVFALYALTLSRTTAFWDTSEYIATGTSSGSHIRPAIRPLSYSRVRGPCSWLLWDCR